jgi:hypothetical protein
VLSKVSVAVGVAIGLKDSALYRYIGYVIYSGMGVHLKKNCEGFPLFFTFENFKRAFLGDMKRWWSRK